MQPMEGFAPRVRAVLGPTNTGKTHLAMERLMGHASGIIGFPLRLLARENYDRMVARKGARHVALITGEEKIVPPEARWFSCTVEAMPLDRQAEFVAVDEIQLCADPDRGHVFTDRLLHARGLVETMFLGADTIRPLLQRLVRQAEVDARPRMSQLSYSGPQKLTRLPPRSAVVAFSAGEVYAVAELLRRRRGGCAVVMGRLSPRTRNAQVALYQNKEVDFLVATDAIGMGLNMDVDHVAFAGLHKFDGHRPRPLTAAEVAQIAGRAGRGMRDGTFGTTGTCPPLDDDLVEDVEAHRFEPLEQLAWRNGALDFASVEALLASLTLPPPGPGLVRGHDAADLQTLQALGRDADLAPLAHGRARVRLLWDACQIPDFRKYADDSHVRLCGRVFAHLARDGRLPEDWIAGQIAALSRAEGDIDTLMQRLAGVRVWTYVAARADWLRDAAHWQQRSREVEDLLSDALHERLTTRFVDRRVAHLMRRLDEADETTLAAAVEAQGRVVVEGHAVGRVQGFAFAPDADSVGDDRKLVLRAARRALAAEIPRRVARLEQAADDRFVLSADAALLWEGAAVARLRRGADMLHPAVEVEGGEFLDGAQRERIRLRLRRFLAGHVEGVLAPLLRTAGEDRDAVLRGPLHVLREGAGVAPALPLDPDTRRRLKALGVVAGRFGLFMPAMLKPRAAGLRAVLWAAWHGARAGALPSPGPVCIGHRPDWPTGFAAAMGWMVAGPMLLRLDVAERLAADLAWRSRGRVVPVPAEFSARLSVRAEVVPALLHALGARPVPAETLPEGQFGPPAPAGMVVRSPRRPVPEVRSGGDGRFAALAALRR
jgi:ATP-dependent RNA helicase SUPV3L1/SUV3